MRWGTYFAVCAAVISIGLALGVTMPLVSLRLEGWGYDSFAIGVMAATPAVGVLLGASLAGSLATRLGTTTLMQLCLLLGALSVALLALVQDYAVWVALRLFIGVALTVVFILGESWINQLAVEKWRGRLVALYGWADLVFTHISARVPGSWRRPFAPSTPGFPPSNISSFKACAKSCA